jgi:hypothetical protein
MHESDIPHALAVKYARYVDDRLFDKMGEIMSEDFTQHGPRFDAGSLAEFIQSLSVLDNYSATFHIIGNQYGEWKNDIYLGETWCVASHIYEKEGVTRKLDMGIRYQDVIENNGGIAKYISRDLKVVWSQDLPCHA